MNRQLIALRPCRPNVSGMVHIDGNQALIQTKGVSNGLAYLVMRDGRVYSSPLHVDLAGRKAKITFRDGVVQVIVIGDGHTPIMYGTMPGVKTSPDIIAKKLWGNNANTIETQNNTDTKSENKSTAEAQTVSVAKPQTHNPPEAVTAVSEAIELQNSSEGTTSELSDRFAKYTNQTQNINHDLPNTDNYNNSPNNPNPETLDSQQDRNRMTHSAFNEAIQNRNSERSTRTAIDSQQNIPEQDSIEALSSNILDESLIHNAQNVGSKYSVQQTLAQDSATTSFMRNVASLNADIQNRSNKIKESWQTPVQNRITPTDNALEDAFASRNRNNITEYSEQQTLDNSMMADFLRNDVFLNINKQNESSVSSDTQQTPLYNGTQNFEWTNEIPNANINIIGDPYTQFPQMPEVILPEDPDVDTFSQETSFLQPEDEQYDTSAFNAFAEQDIAATDNFALETNTQEIEENQWKPTNTPVTASVNSEADVETEDQYEHTQEVFLPEPESIYTYYEDDDNTVMQTSVGDSQQITSDEVFLPTPEFVYTYDEDSATPVSSNNTSQQALDESFLPTSAPPDTVLSAEDGKSVEVAAVGTPNGKEDENMKKWTIYGLDNSNNEYDNVLLNLNQRAQPAAQTSEQWNQLSPAEFAPTNNMPQQPTGIATQQPLAAANSAQTTIAPSSTPFDNTTLQYCPCDGTSNSVSALSITTQDADSTPDSLYSSRNPDPAPQRPFNTGQLPFNESQYRVRPNTINYPEYNQPTSVMRNAFPRIYPGMDWYVYKLSGNSHYLRSRDGMLTAIFSNPSAYPPAGIPQNARYLQSRNGMGYWVYS